MRIRGLLATTFSALLLAALMGCAPSLRLGPARSPRGVVFRLHAPDAKRVSVIGDFNGWDATRHPLQGPDARGVWQTLVVTDLRRLEYLFVVDGVRRPDPLAQSRADDGFGGVNSLFLAP